MCIVSVQESVTEIGIEFPGTGVSYRWLWVTLCGCWELSLGPLDEQQVLSTTGPFLQPHHSLSSEMPVWWGEWHVHFAVVLGYYAGEKDYLWPK